MLGSGPCRAAGPSPRRSEPREPCVVGGDDDVAVDALALRERALDLREVLGVVVDVLVVVDLDAGLGRELLERGCFFGFRRRRCSAASSRSSGRLQLVAVRTAAATAAAGGEQAGKRQQMLRRRRAAGALLVISVVILLLLGDRSTTNVDSGSSSVTAVPGRARRRQSRRSGRRRHVAGGRVDDELRGDADVRGLGDCAREAVRPPSSPKRDLLRPDAGRDRARLARRPLGRRCRRRDGRRRRPRRSGQQVRLAEEAGDERRRGRS